MMKSSSPVSCQELQEVDNGVEMQDFKINQHRYSFSPSSDPIYFEWLKSNLVPASLRAHLMAPRPSALSPDVPPLLLPASSPPVRDKATAEQKKKETKGEEV